MSESGTNHAFDMAAATLFVGGGEQQELFDRAADFFCQKAASKADELTPIPRNPVFTAETLKKHRPEAYNLIVWMRLQCMDLRYTARIAEVSTNTVAAIDRQIDQSANVETIRKALAGNARYLARLTLERIEEILRDRNRDDLDEGKLANLLKTLVEKSELLSGNATERIEWKPKAKPSSAYEEFIQDAEVIETETHPGGENFEERGGRMLGDGAGSVDAGGLAGGDTEGQGDGEHGYSSEGNQDV